MMTVRFEQDIVEYHTPNGEFNGSGLVYYIFNESGIYEFDSRPTLNGLAKMSIPIKEKDAKFGDLVSWLGIRFRGRGSAGMYDGVCCTGC